VVLLKNGKLLAYKPSQDCKLHHISDEPAVVFDGTILRFQRGPA